MLYPARMAHVALTTDDVNRLCHDGLKAWHGVCCCAVYRYQLDWSEYYMCTHFLVMHWSSIGSGKPRKLPSKECTQAKVSRRREQSVLRTKHQSRCHKFHHSASGHVGLVVQFAFLRLLLATVFDHVLHGGGVVRLTRAACTGPAIL